MKFEQILLEDSCSNPFSEGLGTYYFLFRYVSSLGWPGGGMAAGRG